MCNDVKFRSLVPKIKPSNVIITNSLHNSSPNGNVQYVVHNFKKMQTFAGLFSVKLRSDHLFPNILAPLERFS